MTTSNLERAFLTRWRQLAPDAPEPEREWMFAAGIGRRWRFDFAWPDAKVAVEIDGGQWAPHGGRHNTDRDRDKMNHAAVLGWRVMRFSASMLRDDPAGVVAMVMEALGG